MVSLDLLRRYAQLHELSLVDDLNPTGHAQVMDEIVGGVVQREYTYGLQRISQYQVIGNLWTPSFYVYDGAGSVRQLANAAGAVTDTYEYDAFGVTLSHTGTMPNNYMYRGEQYDPDLGLYYRARYYNSLTGRFLSRDPEAGKPIDPKTLHKYLYAGGDPVNAQDPSGRASIIEWILLNKKWITGVVVAGVLGRYILEAFALIPEELERALPPDIHDPSEPPPGFGGPGNPTQPPINGPPTAGSD